MQLTGLTSCTMVGEIINKVSEWIIDFGIKDKELINEEILYYIEN